MAVAPENAASPPAPPRWLADEMLGKLARYLRFLGHDTAYVRGLDDEEVVALAEREHRTLLTRDRDLASRTRPSLLLKSADLPGQLVEVRLRFPNLPFEVTLDRCPECNAELVPWHPPADDSAWPPELPRELVAAGLEVRRCPSCGRHFWDGSHAARIREVVGHSRPEVGTP
jgi:uncharacterized protein with PIN domain